MSDPHFFSCINHIFSMSDFSLRSMFPEIRHSKDSVGAIKGFFEGFRVIEIGLDEVDGGKLGFELLCRGRWR
jgi:hypothetical protein